MAWRVQNGEDRLLWSYWQRRGGRLSREVVIPVNGPGRPRRIDAVITGGAGTERSEAPWQGTWDAAELEVIEVKALLNEEVIGQVAAARVEAARAGDRPVSSVRAVVLVAESLDPDLEDVCNSLGIERVVETNCEVLALPLAHDDPLLTNLERYAREHGLPGRTAALEAIVRESLR